ncbi:AT-hook motif nuclear-localized protein 10-like isoform X1 [Zingiber officinale]|uniref:AT-hook motif nuclear-localized protein 10-like isoform X1 n=1 Tax=Zingiber officinale TaxID=94328 RepID=UPI001C4B5245|nr:AT-hook motif nuclear-localized protein 10-like isoform X1 [Zingiber officinale]XP_042448150.1 AT-hook motif nuclear-localized protein 10-like isoform X1 [Zingiber officinale]
MHLSADFLFNSRPSSWKLLNLQPFEGLKIQNFIISVECVSSSLPCMEVRPDWIMASRESPFNISLQPVPSMQSVRLAYTADGTAIYKPVSSSPPAAPQPPPTYQGGGGGGGSPGAADAGSAALTAHSLNMNMTMGEPIKRKRGRPRKYGPDGLALTPLSMAGPLSPSGMGNTAPSSSTNGAKKRGRPPGSTNKPKMSALGPAGTSFTPHVITVMPGEDVSSKIMSFSQQGSRTICVLSANGAVSNVTLRQPATSGGNVTYEGKFEILSLSGSFMLSESGGQRSRTGGLSVSLAGPDGRVLGGGVAGLLLASSPVQVVVGSFIPDGKKELKQANLTEPVSTTGKLVAGRTTGASSPLSRGALSESSGSPLNQSVGACNNINPHGLSTIPWK